MGQKVNPIGLRLKINRSWDSVWYVKKDLYAKTLHEDLAVRKIVESKYKKKGVVRIGIDRFPDKIYVKLHSTRPGVVIGQKGKNIEELKKTLSAVVSKPLEVKIIEISKPDSIAQSVSDTIAVQIEERMPFRRTMKQSMRSAIRSGVQGIRVIVSGRLNGAEMARSHQYLEGRVPLHTLRAMIDYGFSEADTTYGKIGVKVWIYTGDFLGRKVLTSVDDDKYSVKRREV